MKLFAELVHCCLFHFFCTCSYLIDVSVCFTYPNAAHVYQQQIIFVYTSNPQPPITLKWNRCLVIWLMLPLCVCPAVIVSYWKFTEEHQLNVNGVSMTLLPGSIGSFIWAFFLPRAEFYVNNASHRLGKKPHASDTWWQFASILWLWVWKISTCHANGMHKKCDTVYNPHQLACPGFWFYSYQCGAMKRQSNISKRLCMCVVCKWFWIDLDQPHAMPNGYSKTKIGRKQRYVVGIQREKPQSIAITITFLRLCRL